MVPTGGGKYLGVRFQLPQGVEWLALGVVVQTCQAYECRFDRCSSRYDILDEVLSVADSDHLTREGMTSTMLLQPASRPAQRSIGGFEAMDVSDKQWLDRPGQW